MRAMGVEMNVEGGDPQAIQVLWGKFAFFVALSATSTTQRSA